MATLQIAEHSGGSLPPFPERSAAGFSTYRYYLKLQKRHMYIFLQQNIFSHAGD